MNSDPERSSEHEAYGTLEEVVADAMLEAGPCTLIQIRDEDGEVRFFLVSHWLIG